jgi:DNA-binding NarL/FixJ family response regulator
MPRTHTDEGLHAAQRIRDKHPDVGVLVLSQYLESSYAMRLLEAHPEQLGYLLKEPVFAASALVNAVRRVCEGETVVDPTLVSSLFGRRRREDSLGELTHGSERALARRLPTRRSPSGCTSPSAPSRPTSPRSSSSCT